MIHLQPQSQCKKESDKKPFQELDALDLMKKYSVIEQLRRDLGAKIPTEVSSQNKETKKEVSPQNKQTNREEIENVIETDGGKTKRETEDIERNFARSKDPYGNDLITFEVITDIFKHYLFMKLS